MEDVRADRVTCETDRNISRCDGCLLASHEEPR